MADFLPVVHLPLSQIILRPDSLQKQLNVIERPRRFLLFRPCDEVKNHCSVFVVSCLASEDKDGELSITRLKFGQN